MKRTNLGMQTRGCVSKFRIIPDLPSVYFSVLVRRYRKLYGILHYGIIWEEVEFRSNFSILLLLLYEPLKWD